MTIAPRGPEMPAAVLDETFSSSTRHWIEPTSIGPGTTFGAPERTREGRPPAVGLRRRSQHDRIGRPRRGSRHNPRSGRPGSRSPGVEPREFVEVGLARGLSPDGRTAEQFLGGHPRQVDRRIGMDQHDGVARDRSATSRLYIARASPNRPS